MGPNLTRNHILYYKRQLEELIGKETTTLFGSDLPEIYYKETPPKMDYNYIANPEAIRKCTREQIALYEQNEDFQYLIGIKDILYPNHQRTRELKHTSPPIIR